MPPPPQTKPRRFPASLTVTLVVVALAVVVLVLLSLAIFGVDRFFTRFGLGG
jgi:hypothetical protein